MTTTRTAAADIHTHRAARAATRRRAALTAAADAADYAAALADVDAADTAAPAPAAADTVGTAAPAPARHTLADALAAPVARGLAAGIAADAAGGTIAAGGTAAPAAGYVVGGVVPSLVTDGTAPTVHELAAWTVTTAAGAADVVGWWTDTDTGRLYVDASDVVTDRAAALELAAARGELAVWDLAAAAEIRTGN